MIPNEIVFASIIANSVQDTLVFKIDQTHSVQSGLKALNALQIYISTKNREPNQVEYDKLVRI